MRSFIFTFHLPFLILFFLWLLPLKLFSACRGHCSQRNRDACSHLCICTGKIYLRFQTWDGKSMEHNFLLLIQRKRPLRHFLHQVWQLSMSFSFIKMIRLMTTCFYFSLAYLSSKSLSQNKGCRTYMGFLEISFFLSFLAWNFFFCQKYSVLVRFRRALKWVFDFEEAC